MIGYYLPDIQLSQRGRIEKISIKVAGSIYRACEQAIKRLELLDMCAIEIEDIIIIIIKLENSTLTIIKESK